MYPHWALFCAVLPLLAVCSGPDNCTLHENGFHGVSPELESLLCYNDYKTHISCQWSEKLSTPARTPLELWNSYDSRESLCERSYGPFVGQDPHHRLARCRFNTSLFAIGIDHTFFFKTTPATSCSSFSLDLSQRLRVRPPVDLSVRVSEEGHQLIQWSSPYPASSALSHQLTYQLSYEREGQDTWTSERLTETQLKLRLLPGCRYEARVRAMRIPDGLWSKWSPLVAWKTPEAADQTPSVQCVLDGEEKVMCSWELRKELAHFITYQLACRHKHTHDIPKTCCVDLKITPVSRHSEALLRYSCSLTSSHPEQLTLELIQARNAKSFESHRHIRPNPPVDVRVAKKGENWNITWKKPNPDLRLSYQVLYWNTLNKEDRHLKDISGGFTSLTITGASLSPSQLYKVQVRALLPREDPTYAGVDSAWTQPEEWLSHSGSTWSPETLIYVCSSVLVAILFLTLFFSVQACRRKVMAWLTSGPSPNKSKLFLENKNLSFGPALLQKENMDDFRVYHLGSFSYCPTSSSPETKWDMSLSEDEGCLDCDHLTSCEIIYSNSFNGPYMFCESTSELCQVAADDQQEAQDKDAHSGSDSVLNAEPFSPIISCGTGDYVFLPNPGLSKSTGELVSHGLHSNNNNTTEVEDERGGQDIEEEDQSQTKVQSGPSNGSLQTGATQVGGSNRCCEWEGPSLKYPVS